jgi:hypothetical protein
MKGSFTHINNKDTRLPKTKKGVVGGGGEEQCGCKKNTSMGALTTYGSLHYPPIPSPPHTLQKGYFFVGWER